MAGTKNTDINTVLFPVEKRLLYFCDASKNLFGEEDSDPTYHQVPRFEAVVDVERGHTFAVVSENYRLVMNKEALKLGEQCFLQVFSTTTVHGMELFNIILPQTRSFCHVDFIHKGHAVTPFDKDNWWPFLRVTNSYNKTKPLRFDLGFCRAICTNGVIFGREHIVFKYYHTNEQFDAKATFKVDTSRLKALETTFIEQMHNLKRFYVSPEHMLALACKAFGIEITDETMQKPKRRENLLKFGEEIQRLTAVYFKHLEPNGYAALNVLSDFAARPHGYISQEAMIDPLQKRCGVWTVDFLETIKDDKFDYEKYLGRFAECARILARSVPEAE